MNGVIKALDYQKFCRVCLQSTAELVSCFTTLVVEDVSYTIIEILKLLSSEQNIEDSGYYPKSICSTCKELVNATVHLKIKFENTSQLLKTCIHSSDYKNNHDRTVEVNNSKIEDDGDNNTIDFERSDEEIELSKTSPCNSDKNQATSGVIPIEIQLKHQSDEISNDTRKSRVANSNKLKNLEEKAKRFLKKKNIYYSLAQTNYNHICPFCMINLPNAIEVKKHAVNHKTLKKYFKGNRVSDKAKFFSTSRETNTIFNRKEILHKCVYCRKELTTDNFWKHAIEHNRKKEFRCSKCPRVFRKKNHLNSHITYTHLEELPYQCDECNKGFVIKENYDAHLLTHTNPDVLPYKCEKCDQSFTNKKHLYYHNFKHTDYGSFSARYKTHRCKDCLRTFDTADDLQVHHVQWHNKKRNKIEVKMNADGFYKCDVCSKTYKHAVAFKHHIRQSHGPKKLCSLCGATVANLKQHLISHQEKKDPLECHICHRLLASKVTLTRHIRVHTGEKPYKCSFCDKTFKDHYPMKVHERIHKGEKKHICAVCGKGFLEKSYMLKHLRGVHGK